MNDRKAFPLATGVLDYFPDALLAVAAVSLAGAKQHGSMAGDYPTWDRTKSLDHADSLMRHLLERGRLDTDGHSHTAKVAWRALALLQQELEQTAREDDLQSSVEAAMSQDHEAAQWTREEIDAAKAALTPAQEINRLAPFDAEEERQIREAANREADGVPIPKFLTTPKSRTKMPPA